MNPLSLAILRLPRPLTEEDAEWLNEQLEARLAQHLGDRRRAGLPIVIAEISAEDRKEGDHG